MLDRHLACIVALAALVFAVVAQGQYSTAPNGYYPFGYAGSTFTGNLESVDAENQGLTLTYTKGGKVERFAGRLMAACQNLLIRFTAASFTSPTADASVLSAPQKN